MTVKLWVAVAAHNPMQRVQNLLKVAENYAAFDADVTLNFYINYEAQADVKTLETVFDVVDCKINITVADPAYEGWYLTWAHKNDLASAVLNKQYDYFIYQEDDMGIQNHHFNYYRKWRPRLAQHGLVPGFVRYENFRGSKIPFDNQERHPLGGRTRKIWGDIDFPVEARLIVDHEIHFFSQCSNPYYGAMILDWHEANAYIRSASFDHNLSVAVVGYRGWPIADRSSMGTAFEQVPEGYQHKRCVPIRAKDDLFEVVDCALIEHYGSKYSSALASNGTKLLDSDHIFHLATRD